MPRPLPLDKDNCKRKKDNGRLSKSNKRKKTKSWNFSDSKRSRNNRKSNNKKDLKLSKARKLSSNKSSLDKLTDLKPENSSKDKPKSCFKR